MNYSAVLLALAAMTSAPVMAQTSPQQPVQLAAKTGKPEDKVVCRVVNTTGSRLLGERICKTRAQWESDSDTSQDIYDHAERHPTGTPVAGEGQIDLKPH